jgi:hypothetical protein
LQNIELTFFVRNSNAVVHNLVWHLFANCGNKYIYIYIYNKMLFPFQPLIHYLVGCEHFRSVSGKQTMRLLFKLDTLGVCALSCKLQGYLVIHRIALALVRLYIDILLLLYTSTRKFKFDSITLVENSRTEIIECGFGSGRVYKVEIISIFLMALQRR